MVPGEWVVGYVSIIREFRLCCLKLWDKVNRSKCDFKFSNGHQRVLPISNKLIQPTVRYQKGLEMWNVNITYKIMNYLIY
jgi:hypothetical protein